MKTCSIFFRLKNNYTNNIYFRFLDFYAFSMVFFINITYTSYIFLK